MVITAGVRATTCYISLVFMTYLVDYLVISDTAMAKWYFFFFSVEYLLADQRLLDTTNRRFDSPIICGLELITWYEINTSVG